MAINYQFNSKKQNVAKQRTDKRRNARKQKGIYGVNDASVKLLTDRKIRREEQKRQKKIEKKAKKAEKRNKMQTEEDPSGSDEDMQLE